MHRTKNNGSMYAKSQHTGGRSVGDSQNMLPRPHHEFELQKLNQTEFKNIQHYANGYQTDIPQGRASIGMTHPAGYHKSKSTIQEENRSSATANKSYQPVPDGRFYTKANFFTLEQRQEAELLSSGEDQFSGQQHPEGGAVPFPQAEGLYNQQIRRQAGPDHMDEHYGFKGEYDTDTRPSRVTLQPISEAKRIQQTGRGHSYQPNHVSANYIQSSHNSQKANRMSGGTTVKK